MALILLLEDTSYREDISLTSAAAFRENKTEFADDTSHKLEAILLSQWRGQVYHCSIPDSTSTPKEQSKCPIKYHLSGFILVFSVYTLG